MEVSRDETPLNVLKTASAALETPIENLPPLFPGIDPDALDTLISSHENAQASPVTVTFEYAGLEIIVHGHELICAHPVDDGQNSPASTDDVDA